MAQRDMFDYGGVARRRWGGGGALGLQRRGRERTLFDFDVPNVWGRLIIQGKHCVCASSRILTQIWVAFAPPE
jgi:hypothetical protein